VRPTPRPRTAAFVAAVLAVASAWQAASVFRPNEWITSNLTVDDTYLALRIAQGWAEHGFPTFDGIHRTNGFQPLWGLILWVLAAATSGPDELLRAALLLTAGCNLAAGWTLARVARVLMPHRPSDAWVAALWAGYMLTGRPSLIALENGLLAMIVTLVLRGVVELVRRPGKGPPPVPRRFWLAIGLGLAAMVWTRLDAAVLAAAALSGLAGWAIRHRAWSGMLTLVAILCVAAIGYGAFNVWANGMLTPVSGAVKRSIAGAQPQALVGAQLAADAAGAANTVLKHAAFGCGLGHPRALNSAARVLIPLVIAAALISGRLAASGWAWLAVSAVFAHALVIRVWLSAYFADALWYYAPQCMLAALACGCAAAAWTERYTVAAVLVGARLVAALWMWTAVPRESAELNQYAAARWLRENIPESERAASWNAGHLAFFSERTVVNLDGLANDAAYLTLLRAGTAGSDYLDSLRVNWVVDYAAGADDAPARLWNWLSRDEWREHIRIGSIPAAQQLVASRRGSLAPPQPRDGAPTDPRP